MQAKGILAIIGLLATYIFLGPAFARADATFDVTGNFTFPGAGTFSGTLTVNTGSGTLDGVDITFEKNLFAFNSIFSSLPRDNEWNLVAVNKNDEELLLRFSTLPNAGSLVGLTSGTIVNGVVLTSAAGGAVPVYGNFNGSITPAIFVPTPNVPDAASLALLGLGSLLPAVQVCTKKGH
jgi:hypothetical protein